MLPFDYQQRTRIVFGAGAVSRLGELSCELGAKRVLVVSDPGVVAVGHAERAVSALRASGLDAAVFDAVRENPDANDVEKCLGVAREYGTDRLVGLGGGSSMDTAKGANFLLTNGG